MAKRKGSRKAPRKAPGKAKQADSAQARQLKQLQQRVEDLTRTVIALYHVGRPAPQADGPALEAAADTDRTVKLRFNKTSGPNAVRLILLDTHEVVLGVGDTQGESAPRNVGATFDVLMEVKGNPNETAVVNVSNAIPTSLQMSARPDGPGNVGTKPMRVVG